MKKVTLSFLSVIISLAFQANIVPGHPKQENTDNKNIRAGSG